MLDANANRAREALRTLDDIARFALERKDLCEASKTLRHEISDCLREARCDAATLIFARDVAGDVGTSVTTQGEASRASLGDVVQSACGRLAESLRSMEECAKALQHPRAAAMLEACRYRAYTLQQQFTIALGSTARRQFRLCVLITQSLCTHHAWERVAAACIEGGADCLQLREKSLTDGELLARARELVAMTRGTPVAVVVNDRPDVAMLARAHGVHLGQTDLPAADVRRLVGASMLLGVSTSTLAEATQAVRDGADMCGVGPMFSTTTKHKPVLAGPAYLRAYLGDTTTRLIPHLAIGGIGVEQVPELVRSGCRGIAVSSVVCGSPRPRDVCEALVAELSRPAQA